MSVKRIALTTEQFRVFGNLVEWNLSDVPPSKWPMIPGLQRGDTIAVMASGTVADPRVLNGIEAVVGFDHLVHETRPNERKREPQGNAYHYVIERIRRSDYPYILHGPFSSETRVGHWFDVDDLGIYWSNSEGNDST